METCTAAMSDALIAGESAYVTAGVKDAPVPSAVAGDVKSDPPLASVSVTCSVDPPAGGVDVAHGEARNRLVVALNDERRGE